MAEIRTDRTELFSSQMDLKLIVCGPVGLSCKLLLLSFQLSNYYGITCVHKVVSMVCFLNPKTGNFLFTRRFCLFVCLFVHFPITRLIIAAIIQIFFLSLSLSVSPCGGIF